VSLVYAASILPDAVAAGQALLANLVVTLEDMGVALPERRGLVPGDVVPWDCDQLIVNFMGLSRGQPAVPDQPQTTAQLPSQLILVYEFRITLLRHIATISGRGNPPKLPSTQTMAANYATVAGDARDLALALMNIHRNYVLAAPGILFGWGPVAPVGPEGALSGVVSPVHFMAGQNLAGGF
jgi:hypothetical protein